MTTSGRVVGVCAASVIFGVICILTGMQNIKTRTAEECGKRRLLNKALGADNSYEGSKAVMVGWTRIVMGVAMIVFGIVFIFAGPFLAE